MTKTKTAALRTLDEVWAQGFADGAADPPLSQAESDKVAAILAPYYRQLDAREAAGRRDHGHQ